jgi:hypothetical protein
MGFEVDMEDGDGDGDDDDVASTFVNESVLPTHVIAATLAAAKQSDRDGEEPTNLTPPVLPPVPEMAPVAPRRISEPAMQVAAPAPAPAPGPAHGSGASSPRIRVETEPAALLPPPMVAPAYPSAAPYTQQQDHRPVLPQQLAAGSSALKHEAVRVASTQAPFGDASNITGVGREQTGDELLPARRRLPVPLIAGGGAIAAILVVVVIVLATRGGKSGSSSGDHTAAAPASGRAHAGTKQVASSETTEPATGTGSATNASAADVVEPTGTSGPTGTSKPVTGGKKVVTGTAGAVTETSPPPAGEGSAATVASNPSTPAPPTQIPSPPPAVAKRPTPTLGGKKVVLEYDNTAPPKEPPKKAVAAATPAVKDEHAVRTARTSYFNGNKKLFAGDANSAIKLYQQALSVYPGYVAGYRGLGLAYAQKGDKANALKAFRTYMSAVPTAKDIPLIKERVTALQKKK